MFMNERKWGDTYNARLITKGESTGVTESSKSKCEHNSTGFYPFTNILVIFYNFTFNKTV